MVGYFVVQSFRFKFIAIVRVAISGEVRLFRRIISAESMAMRVSQVPKPDLPSKSFI
jgi:hypothetical protein